MDYIFGYTDKISVVPGESISAKVSCYGVTKYKSRLVRLIHGDTNPEGPGFKVSHIDSVPTDTHNGREQYVHCGSYVAIKAGAGRIDLSHGVSIQAYVWPTTPLKGPQSIISVSSADGKVSSELSIDAEGRVEFLLNATSALRSHQRLSSREWYFLAATYDAISGESNLYVEPVSRMLRQSAEHVAEQTPEIGALASSDCIVLAGRAAIDSRDSKFAPVMNFNGKIDRPRVAGEPLSREKLQRLSAPGYDSAISERVIGTWDFSKDMGSANIVDISGQDLAGRTVNLPSRAMKGANWSGQFMGWPQCPEEYGAIHFHDDDVYDADWETDFSVKIPEGLPSGVYAIQLEADGERAEDFLPFAVRPPSGGPRSKIAFLLPTMSYLAYANEHMATDSPITQVVSDHVISFQDKDRFLAEHREFGNSTYDWHSDDSGTCHSSRLRPILNMRPKAEGCLGGNGSSLWQFNADLHLTDWLEHMGFGFDVVTDEDLEREGYAILKPYQVVLTGTHAEYVSLRMRNAVETFTQRGGRLVYLSGNGFYWRISLSESFPGAIEVRKGEGGIRTWAAEPGEYYNSFTGEYSGLWRRSGRAPQQLVGVGFIAQGFDVSAAYERLPDSYSERAKFIFDGIDEDLLGDFGLIGGGAAGLEIDHADAKLGTPAHALRLATSTGRHTDVFMLVVEEIFANAPGLSGEQNGVIGSDLVFFECPGGGAVFSVGSIAFCGSLSHNGYSNNISSLLENVLKRFCESTPFEMPERRRDQEPTAG